MDYAGDRSAEETWQGLQERPDAVLVDVRSRPEWTFVGLPDLSALGRRPVLAEWQTYPSMAVDAGFVDGVRRELDALGAGPDTPVYLLCRSGARSRAAAAALTEAGYTAAYNVADGFEGPAGPDGHRGAVAGWKAAGLPWRQG